MSWSWTGWSGFNLSKLISHVAGQKSWTQSVSRRRSCVFLRPLKKSRYLKLWGFSFVPLPRRIHKYAILGENNLGLRGFSVASVFCRPATILRPTEKFLFVGLPVFLHANLGQDLFLNILIHNQLQNHSCPNPIKMPTSGRNVFHKALTINILRVSTMPDTPPVAYIIASSKISKSSARGTMEEAFKKK